jgi:hypothetical protein
MRNQICKYIYPSIFFMINEIFVDQIQFTYRSISLNTENITQEESLVFPQPGGNCMNWMLGHIVEYRNRVLTMLKQQPIWNEGEINCYKRGSNAIAEKDNFLQWQRLLNYLNHTQELLMKTLKEEEITDAEQIKSLARFCFHEAYHAGQIGLLRRVLGKEGQIK